MTLAEVISAAMLAHDGDGPPSAAVAAAVARHLTSDAVLRRSVRSACEADGSADPCAFPECSCIGKPVIVRAALAAATAQTEG